MSDHPATPTRSPRASLAFAIVTTALTGASNALAAGPEVRLLQELAGERLLGRVFGLRDALGNLAYVVAFPLMRR